jgi:hypothetical protein
MRNAVINIISRKANGVPLVENESMNTTGYPDFEEVVQNYPNLARSYIDWLMELKDLMKSVLTNPPDRKIN